MAARRRRTARSSLHSKNKANTVHFKRAKGGGLVRLARLSACLRPRRRRAFPSFPRSLPRFSRSPVRTKSLMIAPYIHIFIKPNMRPRRGRTCDHGADYRQKQRPGTFAIRLLAPGRQGSSFRLPKSTSAVSQPTETENGDGLSRGLQASWQCCGAGRQSKPEADVAGAIGGRVAAAPGSAAAASAAVPAPAPSHTSRPRGRSSVSVTRRERRHAVVSASRRNAVMDVTDAASSSSPRSPR